MRHETIDEGGIDHAREREAESLADHATNEDLEAGDGRLRQIGIQKSFGEGSCEGSNK